MAVPERGDADARDQVQIPLTLASEERAALARLEDHRGAAVDLQHVLRVEGDGIV